MASVEGFEPTLLGSRGRHPGPLDDTDRSDRRTAVPHPGFEPGDDRLEDGGSSIEHAGQRAERESRPLERRSVRFSRSFRALA